MIKTIFVEKPELLVEMALKRASKRARNEKDKRKREEKKAAYFSNYLIERIEKAAARVPNEKRLGLFGFELLKTMEKERNIRQMRSHLLGAKKLLEKRKRAALKAMRSENEKRKEKAFNELVGRSNSVLKKLTETIDRFNSLQKKLKKLPVVDKKTLTVILAGYPNVGKTTILKRLTGSSPEIAAYAFTTKSLNIGKFEWRHRKVQVIDTPGLLDREPGKRNEIEKQAIVALKHVSDLVCFVVDCTGEAASPEKQKALFGTVKKEFGEKKFAVLLNKADLAGERAKGLKKEFSLPTAISLPENSGKTTEFVACLLFGKGKRTV